MISLRLNYQLPSASFFNIALEILQQLVAIQLESQANIIFQIMYPQYQYPYTQRFPYVEAEDYSNLQSIVKAFPHLELINKQYDWANRKNVIGVVIRSANDDNVHKAIKYGIWTTTLKNRGKLNQMFIKSKSENKEIYLFFSAVKSGMFEGVARLSSNIYEDTFPYWWEDFTQKFKDYFKIQWIYIKDVNYNHFSGLNNYDGQEVTLSKDCDIIEGPTTQKMLEIFSKKPIKNKWIFNDFKYMDERERQYTRKYQSPQQQFQQQPYPLINYMGFGHMNPDQSIPLPPQMLKPIGPDTATNLGFQKNPVSKNRKK